MARQKLEDELPFYAGDLYGELTVASPERRVGPRRFLPGLMLVGVAALAATWLSDHYGIPVILMGLLLGLALNAAAHDNRTHPGLDLVSGLGLRVGIILLGFQITFSKVGAVGAQAFAALLAIMGLSFAAGVLGARYSGQSRGVGILAGGATAICGASAAMALYAVVGRTRVPPAQFTLVLVSVALASAAAMTVYPVIAAYLGLSDKAAGFLVGASIHDVAQAIGGGYSISNAAGEEATMIKLARVTLLAPTVLLVSLWVGRDMAQGTAQLRKVPTLPWFIVAFLVVIALNSFLAVPEGVSSGALTAAKALLLLAVTAAAIRSRLDIIITLGWRAFIPVACATLASFAAALTVAAFLLP